MEEETAQSLIAKEVARQDRMWGALNERADTSKGQLLRAGMAQLDATWARTTYKTPIKTVPGIYPTDWSGFRDYGSDIANLVVAAAFIQQEIKRKLLAGEDTTRTSRTEPYGGPDQPAVQEA